MQAMKRSLLSVALTTLLIAGSFPLAAQNFNAADEQAKADLEQSLKDLNATRADIAKQKIPIVREVSQLEDEVRQESAELARLRRLRDNSDLGLNRLRDQVEAIEAQNDYAASLLDEFVRSFETRIDFSERQLYTEAAEEARLALEDADMSQAERFAKQIDVIGVALDRLEQLVGGYRFEGLALAPNGEILSGEFAAFGPTVFYAASETDLAGLAVTKLNAAEAAIAIPGAEYTAGIRQFVETGEGNIPADITLGKALKIEEGSDTIGEHLAKGGIVGYVILSLGAVCLLIGAIKVIEITGFKTASPEQVQNVLANIQESSAKGSEAAGEVSGAGGELLLAGVENADEKRGSLEEILYEKILACRPKLERFLPFMALTAAAAPLLGLLGTVTGMIKTFNLITIFGTGDAKSLSSGISEALVTTELGLCVAIPSLILHGLLSRMARQKIGDMEQTAVGFVNGLIGNRNSH
ncbi:MAG: MotA/TolQ/ExbB proton channel family protein [Coraliomargarita sp. TMED73]|nr:MAG: MotA/TolQ/ExbB proton channel family protein [Coraliomargarita sp. TMED73]